MSTLRRTSSPSRVTVLVTRECPLKRRRVLNWGSAWILPNKKLLGEQHFAQLCAKW
jgi:hypothetical protein